jgi:3-oxoadipate CoA-transferase alpha subunit
VGVADDLLEALHDQGARELTVVANNAGNGDYGFARLINSGRVRKVICSYPRSGDYSAFLNAYRTKSLELELVPQGTISERMRCHAAGLGGFFSPVSAGTKLAEGKETREIDGRLHVFEKPLKGDIALLRADKADRWGNLTYDKSARNFNPVMAMAADLSVVQVNEMVELGTMDPEAVVTPSIFIDRVVIVGGNV